MGRLLIYSALIPGKIQERADSTPGINGMIRFGPSIEKVNISDYSFPKDLIDKHKPVYDEEGNAREVLFADD